MVRLKNENEKLTAAITGEIDHHSAREIREAIDPNLERSLPKTLVLDFRDVTFMDSSGIGLIMGRYKLIKSMGGEIVIQNASKRIQSVMKLAGVDRLAAIQEDE